MISPILRFATRIAQQKVEKKPLKTFTVTCIVSPRITNSCFEKKKKKKGGGGGKERNMALKKVKTPVLRFTNSRQGEKKPHTLSPFRRAKKGRERRGRLAMDKKMDVAHGRSRWRCGGWGGLLQGTRACTDYCVQIQITIICTPYCNLYCITIVNVCTDCIILGWAVRGSWGSLSGEGRQGGLGSFCFTLYMHYNPYIAKGCPCIGHYLQTIQRLNHDRYWYLILMHVGICKTYQHMYTTGMPKCTKVLLSSASNTLHFLDMHPF